MSPNTARVAYVVKRYPRYSETFIVNEMLAHEAAGLDLEIFSVRPPIDTHFQDAISRVRAPVTYVPSDNAKAATLWHVTQQAAQILPGLWPKLAYAAGEDALDLLQGLWLAGEVRRRKIHICTPILATWRRVWHAWQHILPRYPTPLRHTPKIFFIRTSCQMRWAASCALPPPW